MSSTENDAQPPSPFSRLRSLLRPDRGDIFAVVVFSVLNGGLLLVTPVAVQALVNNVAFGATAPSIAILAGLLFVGLLVGAVVVAVQTFMVEILQRRVFVRLVADLSERLRRISWQIRDDHYNPELVNRFFDVVTIQKAASVLLLDGIGTALSILVGLVLIAFYHPLLLVMDAFILGGVLLVFFIPFRAATRSAIRESTAKYAVAAWLEEIARHPLTFRTSGSETYVNQKSRKLAEEYVVSRRAHYRIVFAQIAAALGLQVAAGTAVLGLGGWLVVQGELTLGQLVAAELIVAVVVQGVAKMGKHAETYYDLAAAVQKVGKLTDLEVEDDDEREHLVREATGPAKLELSGVELSGIGSPPRQVDLVLAPGESLAVTGPSGVGKSRLLELIYGLRQPRGGSVRYDDLHISDIPLNAYRREVAIAAEPDLLEARIEDNLLVGRDHVPVEVLNRALRAVGLLDDLLALPQGLQTQVSPSGAPLSRGQASRLAIARALISRPRLLLIDRLLDRLSEESRHAVADALLTDADTTVVLVTNDSSLASRCTRRLELTRIAENPA